MRSSGAPSTSSSWPRSPGSSALHLIARQVDGPGIAVVIAAALVGAAVAAAYLYVSPVRTFLTVLIPAPLVIGALFLFDSPVTKLLPTEDEPVTAAAAAAPAVPTKTPVVLVVFDELSTVSILDGGGRVDARRFPNFGRLARDSTFYRDTTTVHGWTEHAVPAILTGRLPKHDDLPILADHPQNVFTLLQRGYRMQAYETHTRLCPRRLCRRAEREPASPQPAPAAPPADASEPPTDSFASDVSIVYLHVVLPDSLTDELPPIDQSWRDFRAGGVAPVKGEEPDGRQPAAASPARGCAPVCGLLRTIESSGPGRLAVVHSPVPHTPWRGLPSGKLYLGDTQTIPGLSDFVWEGDPDLTRQAYGRYLLHVGFADHVLGEVLDELEARAIYDRALVVVVSDHGLSFEAGRPRRNPGADTLDEIAFVPLFVKLPRQRRGAVREGLARTVDVLPTIADALGVRNPVGRRRALAPGAGTSRATALWKSWTIRGSS